MDPDGDQRLTFAIDPLIDELDVRRRTRAVAISRDDALLLILRLQDRHKFSNGHGILNRLTVSLDSSTRPTRKREVKKSQ